LILQEWLGIDDYSYINAQPTVIFDSDGQPLSRRINESVSATRLQRNAMTNITMTTPNESTKIAIVVSNVLPTNYENATAIHCKQQTHHQA
jgi:hypothetical protein